MVSNSLSERVEKLEAFESGKFWVIVHILGLKSLYLHIYSLNSFFPS